MQSNECEKQNLNWDSVELVQTTKLLPSSFKHPTSQGHGEQNTAQGRGD